MVIKKAWLDQIQMRTEQNQNQKRCQSHGSTIFLVNIDMFDIKKHVLKLGNWMVTLKQWLEPNKNQAKQNQNQRYSKIWVNFYMFCIKKHVLKLENSMVPLNNYWSKTKTKPDKTKTKYIAKNMAGDKF